MLMLVAIIGLPSGATAQNSSNIKIFIFEYPEEKGLPAVRRDIGKTARGVPKNIFVYHPETGRTSAVYVNMSVTLEDNAAQVRPAGLNAVVLNAISRQLQFKSPEELRDPILFEEIRETAETAFRSAFPQIAYTSFSIDILQVN
jgi:hypothetical protein